MRMLRPLNLCSRFLSIAALMLLGVFPKQVHAQNAEEVLSQPIQKLSNAEIKQAFAQKPENPLTELVTRSDDELLIFSLNLSKVILSDALLTYEDRATGKYYVPLQDFVDAMEFPIEVDSEKGIAKGWLLNEKQIFELDLSKRQAIVKKQKSKISPKEVERHQDGIYVSLDQLQNWFPITLEVSFTELAIIVKSLEPLPIELRFERDKQRENIFSSDGASQEYELQKVKAPLFSFPFISANTQTVYDSDEAVERSASQSGTFLATGIVLGQDAELSVNANTLGAQKIDARGSIGLKDPDRNLFGVGLSEYRLGDVNTRSIPLLASGSAGRGLSFSSKELELGGAEAGEIQLRGELPVGFQVDVMRNGQLLEFLEEPDENGEYVFDLDVFPGLNIFELVFYGPEGQKEIKEERVFIPPNGVEKGVFNISAELIQDETNLFTDRDSNDMDTGEYRLITTAEYGLTQNSSIFTAFADLSLDGDRQKYGLIRYNQSIKGISADATYAQSTNGGKAFSVRAQSIFKGLRWQLQHDYFDEFQSEETERATLGGQLEHATNVRLSGLLPLIKSTPFTLNLDRLTNEEGTQQIDWQARITKNIKKIRLTSEVDQRIQDNTDRQTNLNLQISSRYEKVSLRGALSYEIEPNANLSGVSLNADWNINKKTSFRAAVQRSGSEDPIHTLTIGASRKYDAIRLGFNASYNDDNEFRALLSTSFSVGYDPFKKRPFTKSKRLADTALFAPNVFYDKNNNAIFDESDEWLEDVKFEGGHVNRKELTNKEGKVLLYGISPYERRAFVLDEATLPDAYLRSTIPPKDYILRPGQVVTPNYPIIIVGEVDGQIYNMKYGEKRDAQSIKLQVVNTENQEIVAEGSSEFDGFIIIQEIPVGEYVVRPDPQQMQKLGYCSPDERNILLNAEEPFVSVGDIVLWPKRHVENPAISLGVYKNMQEAKKQWKIMKLEITEALRNFHDSAQTKYAYAIKTEENNYKILINDLTADDAIKTCDLLTERDIPCSVENKMNICAQSASALSQIDYKIIDNQE